MPNAPVTDLETTALLGIWPSDLVPEKKLDPLGLLKAAYLSAVGILEVFNRKIQDAAAAGELSGHGLAKLRVRLAGEALGKVEGLRSGALQNALDRIAAIEADFRKAVDPAQKLGDVRAELRAAEIRSHLRSIDPLEVEGVLRRAASAGDTETLAAALDGPAVFGLVPEGVRPEVEAALWAGLDPAAAKELEQLRRGVEVVRKALVNLDALFQKEAGHDPDPLNIGD